MRERCPPSLATRAPTFLPFALQRMHLRNYFPKAISPELPDKESDACQGKTAVFIPKLKTMRLRFGEQLSWENYPEMLQAVIVGMSVQGLEVSHHWDGAPPRVRLSENALEKLKRHEDQGERDFALMNVYLGRRAGESPELASRMLEGRGEFPLDPLTAFLALSLARLDANSVHFIYCPGAEYDAEGKNNWADTPRWDVARGHIVGDWNWKKRARELYVNASAELIT